MTTTDTTTGRRLGPLEAIPIGEGRTYTVDGEQVAVFRLRDGTLRATQARCPHAGGPLADGQLDLSTIVCPLHARGFSFVDGICAEGDRITLHPVGIEDGHVVLGI
jgi:nitrite reductase (NADH) small subunit